MTRETKIGLLVSLAFVIAVGVLLSDHMVNNTDAKPLPVAGAGSEVAQGLAVPGQPAEGVATPLQPDANPVPGQVIPSVAEVTPTSADPNANTVVVGPPATSEIAIATANTNVPLRQTEIKITPPADAGAIPAGDTGPYVSTLAMGNVGSAAAVPPVASQPAAAEPVDKTSQDYVAVKGDNVAKMAKRFLGADTKANRDLIIAANDTLKKDPSRIVIGRTYQIPVKAIPAAPAVANAPANTPEMPVLMARTEQPASASVTAPAARTYVVKSGDSLWKIAKGNARLVSEIRKLNRDALKGDSLKVGSTLRLPAKDANL